jgi:hypothetical protein
VRAVVVLAAACVALLGFKVHDSRSMNRRSSCTVEEIQALELHVDARRVPVLDGWLDEAAYQTELKRVCRLVPIRYARAERSFYWSTRFTDRLWPGQWLGSWASTCASSEGGHGGFVMNHQGSGAGGWLQFLSSTFYGIIGSAMIEARQAGAANIPASAASWYSPLGQAVAGAAMIHHGRRGEWSGASC